MLIFNLTTINSTKKASPTSTSIAGFPITFQLKQFSAIKARPLHIELTMLSYMCHIKLISAITK